MRDLAISTIGSIVAAIIWAVLAEFTKASAVEHLLNIAKALAPVWAGLGAFFIIRAALFLYRLRTAHDSVFASWFKTHDRQISDTIEAKFNRMESEINNIKRNAESGLLSIREQNSSAINFFHEAFERRLSAVEEIVRRDG